MIERTGFSISDDETRPYINGALFEVDKSSLKMVTTDGHRMTMYREDFEESPKSSKSRILIPHAGIIELKRFLPLGEETLQILVETASLHFIGKVESPTGEEVEMTLSVRLTDSEFPPYEAVIPRSNNKICFVSRNSLLEAVKRVSVLASERHRTISINLKNNTMVLRAEYAEVGEAEESLEVGYDGEPLNIGFNSSYIMQVLGAIEDDQVEIRFGGDLDGAIFKQIGSEDFMGIVMPVRL